MEIVIRKPKLNEADKFFDMLLLLDGETKYMMYEEGERKKTDSTVKNIENMIKSAEEEEDFFLIAECEGEFVGFITANRGRKNRIRHSAYIVVGIRESFRNKGIGAKFFKEIDQWAIKTGIKRLELSVICENEVACYLYRKNGYEIEGIRRESIKIDGILKDEYYMSKIF